MKYITTFFVALTFLFSTAGSAQSISGVVEGYGSVWPSHTECFQNRLGVRSSVTARLGGIEARPYLRFGWWGTCNAKIAGSPLNAEATHALKKLQGAVLQYRFDGGLGLGVRIHREAIHYVWPNPTPPQPYRHDWFPHHGSWEQAEAKCERGSEATAPPGKPDGETCPSVGYEEGVGPHLSYESGFTFVSVSVPVWTWKTLTYTPNVALMRLRTYTRDVKIAVRSKMNAHYEPFGTVTVLKPLGKRFSIGLTGGRYDAPDWSTPPFWMGGLAFRIH